ncbi:glycosyltransferase family 2 protein [Isosphaeraceae bacterium EP7]
MSLVWILAVLAALAVCLAWSCLAARLIGRRHAYAFLGPDSTTVDQPPRIDAIIPARDEEEHLEATLRGLASQDFPDLAMIVVDDQSSDRTAKIAESLADRLGAPIRLVRGVERPAGWVGKTWAVHQGVETSTADWIWFVDADMTLHPRALATAMNLARLHGSDCVSLFPRPVCRTFWQATIATSFLQILAQLYPFDRVNDPSNPEAVAAGGFILVRRSVYLDIGGHESVRGEIVEDIQLARRIKRGGFRLTVALAPELARTHMYGSLAAIGRGLRKNAYAGMDYIFYKFAFGLIFGVLMAWTPLVTLVAGLGFGNLVLIGLGAWGMLAQAAASYPTTRFLGVSPLYAFAFPAGISAYMAIAASSVWQYHRGGTVWKGRRFEATHDELGAR